MAENKTKATTASVDDHLASIGNPVQRQDCQTLVALMRQITREEPRMWGPSIVGFGSYHYRYESGREGDACVTGFAARKSGLAIYLVAAGQDQDALLAQLGQHSMGKACLTIKRLADVDLSVLERLITASVTETRRRHG